MTADVVPAGPTGVVRIALVAGETSGDLLGSHLIAALRAKLPNAVFYGIGGPRMEAQGFDAWYPLEKLAVLGSKGNSARTRETAAPILWMRSPRQAQIDGLT